MALLVCQVDLVGKRFPAKKTTLFAMLHAYSVTVPTEIKQTDTRAAGCVQADRISTKRRSDLAAKTQMLERLQVEQ